MLIQEPVYGLKNFNTPALKEVTQSTLDEVTQSTLDGNDITKYARVSVIIDGSVVMSALKEEEVDHDTNSILPFDSLTFLPERPYKVYIRLEHNDLYLGDIIIVLEEYRLYPKLVQQFLELSTGDNNVGGAWRGARFDGGIGKFSEPGEWIACTGYMNASGLQEDPLFPVEGQGTETKWVEGQVLGYEPGVQHSGFNIITQSWPDSTVPLTNPVIGHVTPESLSLLQAVVARGVDFVKAITFTNCGLVVID